MRFPTSAGLHRWLMAVAAAGAAFLVTVPAAGATPPERVTQSFLREDVPVISCAGGSNAMATFTLTRTVTTFFDRDGTPIREVRQTRVVGTIASEDGTRSAPYGGRIHRVFDFATELATVTGRSLYAELPGRDPATAGRYVFDQQTDTFVLERGRTPTESEAEICAYLYPAG